MQFFALFNSFQTFLQLTIFFGTKFLIFKIQPFRFLNKYFHIWVMRELSPVFFSPGNRQKKHSLKNMMTAGVKLKKLFSKVEVCLPREAFLHVVGHVMQSDFVYSLQRRTFR